jgi:hypothetical protein
MNPSSGGGGEGEQGQEPYPSFYAYVSTDLTNVQALHDFLEGGTDKKVNWDRYTNPSTEEKNTNASTGGKNVFVYIMDGLPFSKDDFQSYSCNSTESHGYVEALENAAKASAERAGNRFPVFMGLDVTNLFLQVADEVSNETDKMMRDIKSEHPTADKENEWRSAIDGPYKTVVTASAYYSSRSPVSPLDVRIRDHTHMLLYRPRVSPVP